VDCTILHSPVLFRNTFKKKGHAIKAIEDYLGHNFRRYIVIKGEKALIHGLKFKVLLWKHEMTSIPVEKYDYPAKRITVQSKKNFRTILRRRERKLKDQENAHNKNI